MKKSLQIFVLSVMALAVVLAGSTPSVSAEPPAQEMEDTSPVRKATVSGTGTVSAEPDSAVLRVGVSTQAEVATDALEQNSEQVQSLIDALVEAGIEEGDIETLRFNMYPRYGDRMEGTETPEIVGYEVSNVIRVQIAEIDRVGELIDVAVGAGANTIENIQFEISDAEELVDQARAAAFEDARLKAVQLAELAEAELGMVLEIQESGTTPGLVLQRDFAVEEAAAAPIQPGEQDVQVRLTVIWEMQ